MLTLIPAYGRRYYSVDEALADWAAGKDFKIHGGPYCSIRDIDEMSRQFKAVSIRWSPGRYTPVG